MIINFLIIIQGKKWDVLWGRETFQGVYLRKSFAENSLEFIADRPECVMDLEKKIYGEHCRRGNR